MTTPEALIKYYDCLKESFNKIEDKDNKSALVNAALRPKIRDELEKSEPLLISYLNYIQVFSLIYSDSFSQICSGILVPLFKTSNIRLTDSDEESGDEIANTQHRMAIKIHETLNSMIKSRVDLTDDLLHSVTKIYPSILGTDDQEKNDIFFSFFKNSLKLCTYLQDSYINTLIPRIVEKLNPPKKLYDSCDPVLRKRDLDKAYDILYHFLASLPDNQRETITEAIITSFTKQFISTTNEDKMYHLILYLCSLEEKYSNMLVELLWKSINDSSISDHERHASVKFLSCFISRANYIHLDQVLDYLHKASSLCINFLTLNQNVNEKDDDDILHSNQMFYYLAQSIFYVISQRYREMYEEDTIMKLHKLGLNQIIASHMKPLEVCERSIEVRFNEVAILYQIAMPSVMEHAGNNYKKMKSDSTSRPRLHFKLPLKEDAKIEDPRIKSLYRGYYDHRNFTVYRN